MFSKFLKAEVVLFGEEDSELGKIKHETTFRDGEIIIHQRIVRDPRERKDEGMQYEVQLEKEEAQSLEFHEQEDEKKHHLGKGKDREEQNQDVMDGSPMRKQNVQGYYQTQENPYGQSYYGLEIDGQYAPQQFCPSPNQPQESPSKPSQHQAPSFSAQSPSKSNPDDLANPLDQDLQIQVLQEMTNDLMDELLQ